MQSPPTPNRGTDRQQCARRACRLIAEYNRASKLGLEGIVSKKLDAPYRSGPSKVWLKSTSSNSRYRRNVLDIFFSWPQENPNLCLGLVLGSFRPGVAPQRSFPTGRRHREPQQHGTAALFYWALSRRSTMSRCCLLLAACCSPVADQRAATCRLHRINDLTINGGKL
jgi:hypothetical protein